MWDPTWAAKKKECEFNNCKNLLRPGSSKVGYKDSKNRTREVIACPDCTWKIMVAPRGTWRINKNCELVPIPAKPFFT